MSQSMVPSSDNNIVITIFRACVIRIGEKDKCGRCAGIDYERKA